MDGLQPKIRNDATDFSQVKAGLINSIWKEMANRKVGDFLGEWISGYSNHTGLNYISGMKQLEEIGLFSFDMNLQAFAFLNHNNILDSIKKYSDWHESSRQARAACYISFTSYLSRKFDGIIPRAQPKKGKGSPTFFKVRKNIKTPALNRAEWAQFLSNLEKINYRDCLIAKTILQGGKRVGEVLRLTTDCINWDRNLITFVQSKTQYEDLITVVTYPKSFIRDLLDYVGGRSGLVFITRQVKEVPRLQLANTFERASEGLPFRVTPHVLRASAVTYLRSQGYSSSDIQKVTGHASVDMVNAYDRGGLEENPTKYVSLI